MVATVLWTTGGVRETGNVNQIWQMVVDEDNDPTSDFGKIDLVRAKDDPTTADNETTRELLRRVHPGVKWGATAAAHVATGCGRTVNAADGAVVTDDAADVVNGSGARTGPWRTPTAWRTT